jgi:SAM-dependent methyltransferase
MLIHKEFNRFLDQPKMAMLAMNPHAGEGGAFGKEDFLIGDVLKELEKQDIKIDGPFPADTFFAYTAHNYDVIISAYHDQGLVPFKMLSRNEGVNVTLGLPYIRTSVDHGTAFDLVGTGKASEQSLERAVITAEKMLTGSIKSDNNAYSHFSTYYDGYMEHVDYKRWVKFMLNSYHKLRKKDPKKILELACGTGNVSNLLVKKGLKVEASDFSTGMLKIASQKPFKPELSCRDMTDKLPTSSYDLILLIFDSINYLLRKRDLSGLFKNVSKALVDKGVFIFDITTVKNSMLYFDGFVNLEDNGNDFFIHQSELNSSKTIQTTRLTMFKNDGLFFKRKDEIHKQRIYKSSVLIDLIKKSGLKLIGIYSMSFDENIDNRNPDLLDSNYTRLFFVAEKNVIQN